QCFYISRKPRTSSRPKRESALVKWGWVWACLPPELSTFNPVFPLPRHRLAHFLGGLAKPSGRTLLQISFDCRNSVRAPQVYVGSFPTHGVQEASLIALFRQRGQLDSRTIGCQPAHKPVATHVDEGILHAHGACDNLLVQDCFVSGAPRLPNKGRGQQCLRLARHEAAAPRASRPRWLVHKAPPAPHPPLQAVLDSPRQLLFEQPACLGWHFPLYGGPCLRLLPEQDRIAQLVQGNFAEPDVMLAENKRLPARAEPFGVSIQNRLASFLGADREVLFLSGDSRTGGQTHQVDRVSRGV